ncbi:MAG: DUF4349 domain-containing protein [Actinophytocola sp.]|nr:DUF4349 domain-containing protein [Actinophytocola sp.]
MGRMGRAVRAGAGMALAAGVVAALVAGCSGGDSVGGFGGQGSMERSADGEAASGMADTAAGPAPPQAGPKLSTAQLTDRKLARSARMTLRIGDVDRATAEARQIATDAGGYVASERSGQKLAALTLSVPSEELDVVLDKLADLGERKSRYITVEDVTDQVVDVDSRVASQRESVRRVRELLDKAKSISDLVAIEGELAQREAELESLLARQDALRGRVDMAPVSLTLREKPAEETDDGGFLGGLASGWGAFTALLAGTAVALGAALPFVVLVGVLAGVGLVLRRWRKHARSGSVTAPSGAGDA